MSNIEMVSLIVTVVCVLSFSVVFTILFRNYYLGQINNIKYGKEDIAIIDNAIYESQRSKKTSSKVLGICGKILSWLLLGGVAVGFTFSLITRLTDNTIVIGNTSMIVIATGSMSERNPRNEYLDTYNLYNQFDAYDIIEISKYESQDEVQLYDVVAFKNKNDTTIVHRIIEILDDGTYITRGDSNASSDNGSHYLTSLSFDKIVGKYTGNHIKLAGIFIIFLQSNSGIITVVSVLYCILMFDRYRVKYYKTVDQRTKYLIDTIKFDVETSTIEEVEARYLEVFKYKEDEFTFDEEGKFIDPNSPKDSPKEEDVGDDNNQEK